MLHGPQNVGILPHHYMVIIANAVTWIYNECWQWCDHDSSIESDKVQMRSWWLDTSTVLRVSKKNSKEYSNVVKLIILQATHGTVRY